MKNDLTWVLEKNIWNDDSYQRLKESLFKQNINFIEIDLKDAYCYLNEICEKISDNVIFYGSLQVAEQIKMKTNWIPGVFYTRKHFDCSYYYPRLGDLLLNSDCYAMLPYGELFRKKDFIFENFGIKNTVFIRPNSGHKPFDGRLIYEEKYNEIENLTLKDLSPEELVVVSSPKNIIKEWRFVICEGEIITGSAYKSCGFLEIEKSYTEEAYKLAEKTLKRYNPDPVWVCDVCETIHGEFYILEVGCFSCAGMYDCDADIIVKRISQKSIEKYLEICQD
ncbi:MAG: ATP-grasp domain-containing protein [bacterium]